MQIFYYISLLSCIGYYAWVLHKFGIPSALSQSAYLFGSNGIIKFPIAILLIAAPLAPYWYGVAYNQHQWITLLIIFGMFCVAFTPRFKQGTLSIKRKVHFGGAILAAVLSQVWVWITFGGNVWVYSLIAVGVALCLGYLTPGRTRDLETNKIYYRPSYFFWLQIVCFASIYISLFPLL